MKQTAFIAHVLYVVVLLAVTAGFSYAQNTPAVPVAGVEAEALVGTKTNQLTVIELFSSQACVFCPKADDLLSDMIENENIIGLSCHVDYFDVSEGSLSKPFCTERQNMYEAALRAGPNFTPQLVINGEYDVLGYKLQDISNIIHKAGLRAPARIMVEALKDKNIYKLVLPEIKLTQPATINILFIDNPHIIKIAEGSNRGRTMNYQNIVSRIDSVMQWDGSGKTLKAQLVLGKGHKGFVILASDPHTQNILAAGQYKKPVTTVSKP